MTLEGETSPPMNPMSSTNSTNPLTTMTAIDWQKDTDGIVTLTFNDPNRSVNTLTADFVASLGAAITRLRSELTGVTGVILASAKKTFFAGGDLNLILGFQPGEEATVMEFSAVLKNHLRELETLGRPVVAAINGAALGGGLEVALAAHHRIVADVPGAVVGFPEVSLGLLPGGGGIVRTVRLIGIAIAVGEVLTTAKRYSPAAALDIGIIDDVVDTVDALLPAARAWIAANPAAAQPWDAPGFRLPGGDANSPALAAQLPAFPALLRKKLKGNPQIAPRAILAAAVEGAQVGFEDASLIESRYFANLVTSSIAKNMIKSTFFDLQSVNAGGNRPAGFEATTVKRLGILGAGMMGAGIAYVAAKAGIQVVLNDVSLGAAERGKLYSERLLARAVERGTSTSQQADDLLALITPSADVTDCVDVDFVIEAVYESIEVKQGVFRSIENIVRPDAVLGSNTSTLPISNLAKGVQNAEKFVGIHFFSPVDKMPLVEIIVGDETSNETLARAFDFSRQIGKTPIVVNDSRGFFTSRVIMTFINEAVAAIGEGVPAASVEQATLQAGYPSGALQLMDELTLTLPRRIRDEARAAAAASGQFFIEHGADIVIDRMVDEFDRLGRSTGAGFYDYDDAGKRIGLWPGLGRAFGSKSGAEAESLLFEDLKERMLFAEAIESVKCLDEGVLRSVADANIGSLLGIGFPTWTGGTLQYINSYPGGSAGFVERAAELRARYGDRFTTPTSLNEMAKTGALYE